MPVEGHVVSLLSSLSHEPCSFYSSAATLWPDPQAPLPVAETDMGPPGSLAVPGKESPAEPAGFGKLHCWLLEPPLAGPGKLGSGLWLGTILESSEGELTTMYSRCYACPCLWACGTSWLLVGLLDLTPSAPGRGSWMGLSTHRWHPR